MKLKSLIFCSLFLSISLLYGQMREIQFEEFTLDNGLHVILHQDNAVPLVAINVLYHVGSKNEKPDRTGFAHFFEHLMFEGSENIARGDYAKICEAAGGENNAGTSFDQTVYYELLPSNQLELGLWLESERMLHLRIDDVGVETQRSVIKEERKQRYDNQPYGSLLEEVFQHAFKVHPYRWVPIGSIQYIDQAKLEEFLEFYKTFYVPNNATLSIAGDIDIDKTKELVKLYFGDIPKGKNDIYRPKDIEPEKTEEVRDTVYDNIQLPAVIMAYHMPKQGSEDYYALDMLTKILSGGESARLYKELVDKTQIALQVVSVPLALEDPGLFIVFGLPNIGIDPLKFEDAINVELEKVKADLVDEKEFQKIRNQIESQFISGYSSMAGIASSLANYHVFYGDANLINTEIERYMKVTREDLKRVANKYLIKSNRVVLYYLPKMN